MSKKRNVYSPSDKPKFVYLDKYTRNKFKVDIKLEEFEAEVKSLKKRVKKNRIGLLILGVSVVILAIAGMLN